MLMNLWVIDTSTKDIHQIGTDTHDSLIFMNGGVEYYNMQNGCGTFGEDGYKFVDPPLNEKDEYVEVTPDVLRVNKKMIHHDLVKALEDGKLNEAIAKAALRNQQNDF